MCILYYNILTFQTGVLTVAVLPLRVAAIMVLLVLAWLLACVGLLGLSEEDLQAAPITGWRRSVDYSPPKWWAKLY